MDRFNALVSIYGRLRALKIYSEDIIEVREKYMEEREKMKA